MINVTNNSILALWREISHCNRLSHIVIFLPDGLDLELILPDEGLRVWFVFLSEDNQLVIAKKWNKYEKEIVGTQNKNGAKKWIRRHKNNRSSDHNKGRSLKKWYTFFKTICLVASQWKCLEFRDFQNLNIQWYKWHQNQTCYGTVW